MKSPIKSIREKCLDCCGTANEVKICPCDGKQSSWCALWPYRLGRRPDGGKKRVLSDAQRQAMRERGKKLAESRKAKKESLTTPQLLNEARTFF